MSPNTSSVIGTPRAILRLEGVAVFILAATIYYHAGYSWVLFVALFLAPDLSLLGYLAGPRTGALSYNLLHSYIGPIGLAIYAIAASESAAVALIWSAHLGFDRLLGYGLKYSTGFSDTHLGRIGRRSADGDPLSRP